MKIVNLITTQVLLLLLLLLIIIIMILRIIVSMLLLLIKHENLKSDTAKTLLSILDGNEQEKSTFDFNNDSNPQSSSSSSGFKFINPYSKNGRKISRSIKNLKPETGIVKNSISITANDIDKTISYDKSESLPLPKKQTSQDSSIDKLEKKSNEQLNKDSSGEKPSSSTNGFSFKKDLVSPSKIP